MADLTQHSSCQLPNNKYERLSLRPSLPVICEGFRASSTLSIVSISDKLAGQVPSTPYGTHSALVLFSRCPVRQEPPKGLEASKSSCFCLVKTAVCIASEQVGPVEWY